MFPTVLFAGLLSGIASGPVTQAPTRVSPAIVRPQPMATSIPTMSVTPAAITFTATDPTGTPVVNGSAGAVVQWSIAGGKTTKGWTLGVSAPTTFSACSTVPASAVNVTCGSVTGGNAGACSAATSLTNSPVTIASGNESTGTVNYTVNLTFTLQDSWEYIASSSCSLAVTYTITAN